MKRRENLGQYSTNASLASADGRTKLGKTMATFRDALIEHVGGNPSAPEMLIINAAVTKAVRLQLGQEKALRDATEQDSHNWLAWSESLRRDLIALGLESRKDAPIDLRDYIREREAS